MKAQTSSLSKISKARSVLMVMDFLGIRRERFMELRKQYGNLDGLYSEMENRISGLN